MSNSIASTIKETLGGTTGPAQADAKKADLADNQIIQECNKMVIQQTAAQFHPATPVDKGSELIDSMVVGHKAKELTTKSRRSAVSQKEIDQEVGRPGVTGAEAIAAIQRINRRGEPSR